MTMINFIADEDKKAISPSRLELAALCYTLASNSSWLGSLPAFWCPGIVAET